MLKAKTVNGVNVTQLGETIEMIKNDPEMAKFKFRAQNQWLGGTFNEATVKDFYGAKAQDDSRAELVFRIDEPPVLLGENRGANPVEYLLVGLSGCMTTAMVAHAAAKGIAIDAISSRFEGDIDLRGFLGLSEEVPVGYQEIRVFFKIEANLSEREKKELIEMGKKYSPVYNTLTKGVPVEVGLDK